MNRITEKFKQLKNANRKALITYVTAGDPSAEMSLKILQHLVSNGADILEIGMPFSDPVADGVVIQAAHQRALANGMTLNKVIELVTKFRETDQTTPIVLMGYLNPIETMGYENFVNQLEKVGVDGVLIVDLPPDEGKDLHALLKAKNISPIFLIAPTTSIERAKAIAAAASGFVYVVSLKGVTGANVIHTEAIQQQVQLLQHETTAPIAIGFGIHDRESAAQMAKLADGIVVGSALVSLIEQYQQQPENLLERIGKLAIELNNSLILVK